MSIGGWFCRVKALYTFSMDVVEASMAAVEFERLAGAGDCSRPFRIDSEFKPTGDQPGAIKKLCEGLGCYGLG